MPTPKFTFIIAGYQSESYLPKALESITQQTFRDFEAICYVEESTDRSLAICQEWAQRDARFKIATAPKSGAVSATRNYGIDHAVGEYLVVIDGDDWIAPDMLEKLTAKLNQTGSLDVLAFACAETKTDMVDFTNGPKTTNFSPADASSGVFSGPEAIRRANRAHKPLLCHTWLGVYRFAFLRRHKLYQVDGMLLEDFEWTPKAWYLAEQFAYLDGHSMPIASAPVL